MIQMVTKICVDDYHGKDNGYDDDNQDEDDNDEDDNDDYDDGHHLRMEKEVKVF